MAVTTVPTVLTTRAQTTTKTTPVPRVHVVSTASPDNTEPETQDGSGETGSGKQTSVSPVAEEDSHEDTYHNSTGHGQDAIRSNVSESGQKRILTDPKNITVGSKQFNLGPSR